MEQNKLVNAIRAVARKNTPIFSGVLKYFPKALAEVARVSKAGNDQHNPGTELHWDRSKSKDELDALTRHLLDRASGEELDTDGQRHLAKVAWRALAALEKEIEASRDLLDGSLEGAIQHYENSETQKIAPTNTPGVKGLCPPSTLSASERVAQLVEDARICDDLGIAGGKERRAYIERLQYTAGKLTLDESWEILDGAGEVVGFVALDDASTRGAALKVWAERGHH